MDGKQNTMQRKNQRIKMRELGLEYSDECAHEPSFQAALECVYSKVWQVNGTRVCM